MDKPASARNWSILDTFRDCGDAQLRLKQNATGSTRSAYSVVILVCFQIGDEIRHGIIDTPQSIPSALPRVDPPTRLQNRLSGACFTYSGHFQGILMKFVSSWRPKISQKSP